ncbi:MULTISPECIES: hypothetical protein [Burkholderiaceae]|uniref:hypothetical protein n=1 Tax=Burkholderiaceae TaxID=119060 RepID=UPI000B2F16F4|nr:MULTISPECIES: hypothetical protein [Burkholderiaceae]
MKQAFLSLLFFTATAVTPWFSEVGQACTIGEEMGAQLPFGAIDISNADRLKIANLVFEARKWPAVEIQAVVIAGAYKSERKIEWLKEVRGENVKAYLLMLGIKGGNILIDKKTFTDAMTERAADGSLIVEQVVVSLTPLCDGSCAWMCSDPRVTPHTRLIQ